MAEITSKELALELSKVLKKIALEVNVGSKTISLTQNNVQYNIPIPTVQRSERISRFR